MFPDEGEDEEDVKRARWRVSESVVVVVQGWRAAMLFFFWGREGLDGGGGGGRRLGGRRGIARGGKTRPGIGESVESVESVVGAAAGQCSRSPALSPLFLPLPCLACPPPCNHLCALTPFGLRVTAR